MPPTQAPILRAIRPDDADDIARLAGALNQHFGVTEPAFPPDAIAPLLQGDPPFLAGYVAVAGGQVVAYALTQKFFDTDTGTMATWMLDLFVDAPHRGQGTGRQIIAAIARDADAAGQRMVALAVYRSNPARRLYDRIGAALPEEALVYELRDAALRTLAQEAAA